MGIQTVGLVAKNESGELTPWKFEQPEIGGDDVHIKVIACGICLTDHHFAINYWENSNFPVVPGHEIVGIVEAVGPEVSKFAIGDKVGVGLFIGSCGSCSCCNRRQEQYCSQHFSIINGKTKDGARYFGGFAKDVVVNEKFVVKFPEGLDFYEGAPLMCAGITCYSPMKKFGMDKPGKKIGVIGLGGVGHMAAKLAVAFGQEVTVISRSDSKRHEAINVLGASKFLNSSDPKNLEEAEGSLDFIIDTVGIGKQTNTWLNLLDIDGVLLMIAVPVEPLEVSAPTLVMKRRSIVGSSVGNIQEMEEMLQFCAAKNIAPMIEKVSMDYVNTAFERMLKSDVRYRFVIDVRNSNMN